MHLRPVSIAVCSLLFASAAAAATVEDVTVERDKKRYRVQSRVVVEAPIEAVYDVLADYDDFERVSSIFKDSRFIELGDDGRGVAYTKVGDCILFFCKTIERTETVELEPPVRISTVVLPDKSDLRFGWSEWRLLADGERTRVIYDMEMEPDFWVPPIIGPYLIRKFLREGSIDAADRLEVFAREVAEEGEAP